MIQTNPARQLVYDLAQDMPSVDQEDSFQALLALFLQATGNIRLTQSEAKSASSLSRFLNHYTWSTKGFFKQVQRLQLAQLLARRQAGRRPLLQVLVDLTSIEKTGDFAELEPYLHTLNGKRGIHLVVVYLVLGGYRLPWSMRLWQGAGTTTVVQLALKQLRQLPSSLRQGYRLMVLADGGFGTVDFLKGLRALGLATVVTMRCDRHLEDGRQLREIRGCEVVKPKGLGFIVYATRLRLKGKDGQPGQWRHVVSSKALSGQMIKRWGKRRFAIEGFFKVIKHRFGLHCFGQCSRLGVYRWMLFSWFAYILAYQAHLQEDSSQPPDWGAASSRALSLFVPEFLSKWLLLQVEKLSEMGKSMGWKLILCNCNI